MPVEDAEITAIARKQLEKRGLKIFTSAKVTKVEKGAGSITAHVETSDGKVQQITADRMISAVGVQGNEAPPGVVLIEQVLAVARVGHADALFGHAHGRADEGDFEQEAARRASVAYTVPAFPTAFRYEQSRLRTHWSGRHGSESRSQRGIPRFPGFGLQPV